MPDVSCACGKTLRVPARLVGKKAKCPRCGQVLIVSADGSAEVVQTVRHSTRIMTFEAEESDVGIRGDSGPIRFSCLCGKELVARRGTEGQKIKCPECGRLVKVPEESGGIGETAGGASCPKCGAELAGGAITCSACHANLLTGRTAGAGCPRCDAPLEVGAIKCGKCHLNLVTGQIELPPNPEEEQVASMMQGLTASFTAPFHGLGGVLLAGAFVISLVLPDGWIGKIVGLFVYSFLAFPCLRTAALGEGMGPNSKVFKAVADEWVFPWLATLTAGVVVGIPLIVLGIVFRPDEAGIEGQVFPSLTANTITVLVTIGTGLVLPVALMRAGGFGNAMHGLDPFALLETSKAFPLETLMSVLYLVGISIAAFVVHVVTSAVGAHGAILGTTIFVLGGMWGSFLGSVYHRRKGEMPGHPTTAPKPSTPPPPEK